jgi:ribosomal protein S12 methylthiotransferase
VREERRARFMAVAEAVSAPSCSRPAWARPLQVLVDRPRAGPQGRVGAADARDRRHREDPAAREGQQDLKVGEFARVRIVAADGHDLIGSLV